MSGLLALSSQESVLSNQRRTKPKPTAKAFTAKDAKEKMGLPRMDADERGLENPDAIFQKAYGGCTG